MRSTRGRIARAYTRDGRGGGAKDAGVHDEQLHALIGAARADGAVDARRRGRWLRRQLQEDHTFVDVVRPLAAGDAAVEVWTTGGRAHRGTLLAAGALVVVATDAGVAHVVVDAVVGLRPLEASADAGRRPRDVRDRHLVELLIDLAEHRTPVALCTRDGCVHRGVVEAVGRDVVRLAGDGALLRLGQIVEVVEPPCG